MQETKAQCNVYLNKSIPFFCDQTERSPDVARALLYNIIQFESEPNTNSYDNEEEQRN